MAEIVKSLFGFSPQDLQNARRQEQLDFTNTLARSGRNPQEVAGLMIGANLGQALGGAGARMFGMKDPQIERAAQLDSILQQVQSSIQDPQNPEEFYTKLYEGLNSAGFSREAAEVLSTGQQHIAKYRTELRQGQLAEKQGALADAQAVKALRDNSDQNLPTIARLIKERKEALANGDSEAVALYDKAIEKETQTKKTVDPLVLEEKRQENRIKLEQMKQMNKEGGKTGTKTNQAIAMRGENLMGAVSELTRSLEMITSMPSTVSGGIFGGVKAGESLFTAPLSATAFYFTPEDSRMYQIAASNLGQALATIEFGGFKPNQTAITSYQQKLEFKPGDTPYTKIYALADAKEQAKARAPYSLANPNIPDEQKEILRQSLAKLDEIIPFTPEDVSNMKKKGMSVAEFIKSKEVLIKMEKGFIPSPQQESQIAKVVDAVSKGNLSKDKGVALLKKKGIKVL